LTHPNRGVQSVKKLAHLVAESPAKASAGATELLDPRSQRAVNFHPVLLDQRHQRLEHGQQTVVEGFVDISVLSRERDALLDIEQHQLGQGSRIFSMTSEGSQRVLPKYGAVSAAKAALESHTRQLALELGSRGILVNCINAGVTDTPALRKIPDNEIRISETLRRNPQHRLTTTEDVATVIVALSQPEIKFISGSVIFVDGGESIMP